ncbi:MAG: hypothetical protein JW908_14725 [Anaerolineales bacterium]|nr:hypothetical protein [Anaerolineales bacterium]
MNKPGRLNGGTHFRIRLGLVTTILGLVIFILGINPGIFMLDRSPVVGFVQIAVFLVGLAMICIGGYIGLNALWNGSQKSILADIGLRMVSTGYVIAVASGMADVFGFGTHNFPQIPYFGPLQAIGVMIGEVIISIGLAMLIPFHRLTKKQ